MIEELKKTRLTDFTRDEFRVFVKRFFDADAATEAESNAWTLHFNRLVAPNPSGSDLIYYPEDGVEDSPEGVVREVEEYCREHGLPCFKDSEL